MHPKKDLSWIIGVTGVDHQWCILVHLDDLFLNRSQRITSDYASVDLLLRYSDKIIISRQRKPTVQDRILMRNPFSA
jgi:hypothetical protein